MPVRKVSNASVSYDNGRIHAQVNKCRRPKESSHGSANKTKSAADKAYLAYLAKKHSKKGKKK